MCDAYAAIAGAATLAQGVTQRDAAKNQIAFQEELFQRNASLAQRDRNDAELQLRRRQLQQRAVTAQQLEAINLRGQSARAAAVAEAADSGTTGNTLAILNADFARQTLEAGNVARRNQEFVDQQVDAQSLGLDRQLERSLLSATPPSVAVPNFLSILLNVGTSAVGAYRG